MLGDVSRSAADVASAVDELAAGTEHMSVTTAQLAVAAHAITDAARLQGTGIDSIASLANAAAEQARDVSVFATSSTEMAHQIERLTARIGTESEGTRVRVQDITRVTSEATPAVTALADKSRRITSWRRRSPRWPTRRSSSP